ncbi:MAG: iron-sulfur cluster assembly protein [Solirubrobacteraceae bacterium]
MTEHDVRRALNRIQDPCSVAAGAPAGITDLGLLSEVVVANGPEGACVQVAIRLTDPVCMMGAAFLASAREALASLDGVARADVRLDERSDWSPDDMAPAYRARLEAVRALRRR